jgi:hypothetical protein
MPPRLAVRRAVGVQLPRAMPIYLRTIPLGATDEGHKERAAWDTNTAGAQYQCPYHDCVGRITPPDHLAPPNICPTLGQRPSPCRISPACSDSRH